MTPYFADESVTLYHGDALEVARELPSGSVDCIVTSPPYFALRNYGIEGQYGLEETPDEYVEVMRALFSELRRALAEHGTLWVNIGDSYNAYNGNRGASATGFSRNEPLPSLPKGHGLTVKTLPSKNLLGIPWQLAFALRADGWILRNAIVWHAPNKMPESVSDRLASRYEMMFLFSKSQRYWFDLDPIRVPAAHSFTSAQGGRNAGDVWEINTVPFPGAHFATMPVELAERCIRAGCKPGGVVLDPFSGSGTTGLAAAKHGRRYVGIDLNREYLELSLRTRLRQPGFDFEAVAE